MMNKLILFAIFLASPCFAREYTALVSRVIDGDTFIVQVDLGLDVFKTEVVRIYGINAPESDTKQGQVSKDFLQKAIAGKLIIIDNVKDKREKYGRLLCKVYFEEKDIGEAMLKQKLAVEYLK